MESDHESSIDNQPEASLDKKTEATIDKALEEPIDSHSANEIGDFPEGSINSWANDYYQPSYAIQTATPSKGRSVKRSMISTMRTTEKRRSLSTLALTWKRQEFSRLFMRPG